MKTTNRTASLIFATLALTLIVTSTQTKVASPQAKAAPAPDPKKDKDRAEIRKKVDETLKNLYKAQPKAQAAVQKGYGYAVFSNTGVKILVAGSGKGQGMAVNNQTKKETFMKMLELQAGLGFGVKKFSLVFIFDNDKAFNGFVESGWQFGGQSTVAAKAGDSGAAAAGAANASEGVWVYQITDKGVALEITAKSTKFSKDDDLN